MLTYITALFAYPEQKNRPYELYFSYFKYIASTGVSIILFLDPVFQNTDNANYIITEYKNVRIEWLSIDTSFIQTWGEEIRLPSMRNPTKDTIEYMTIILMKMKCLCMCENLTDSEYLAWIDFGIFHIIKDIEKAQILIKKYTDWKFPTDRIISPKCVPEVIPKNIFESVCWYFAGGILIGSRHLFRHAYERQMELVDAHKPYLTWEINYWYLMRDLFISYDANHNDTILEIPSLFNQSEK